MLDTASGRPAAGVHVSLYRGDDLISRGETDSDGRIRELWRDLEPGSYRLLFHLTGGFFETVALQVRLESGHYHVPLLVSPFSCVSYRGS